MIVLITHLTDRYQPLSIGKELAYLYKTGSRRQGLGDFAILLMLMGIFRSASRLQYTIQDDFYLHTTNDETISTSAESTMLPTSLSVYHKAMRYLQILHPHDDDTQNPLKETIQHHYHTIGIILGLSLGELFCYCGFRVTREEVSHCRDRLMSWMQHSGSDARQVAAHAGRLFGFIRQSRMHGYYEGRALLIACQSLWIFGELTFHLQKKGMLPEEQNSAVPTAIRLDQPLDQEELTSWVAGHYSARPFLAGVGCILGAEGVSRLIREGCRVLGDCGAWGFGPVMGRALALWHKYQTRPMRNA